MRSKVFSVADYAFSEGESFLIDANIWIFLYARQDLDDRRISAYSEALKKIAEKQCPIFVDVLVLSEFINRYARLEKAANLNFKSRNFKEFRDSAEFSNVASSIAVACRKILRQCRRTESLFESVDIDAVLSGYGKSRRDFNDQILGEISRVKGLKVISHDGDFLDLGVTLLTANRRIFSAG
ncbi:MAG TPA: PIN domain-containing protein [Elusimicrobiota bacterium]|nr:PIN domain-containing protein [Elusimicrobiota bacterium]